MTDQWRSMESAPKNGVRFLAYVDEQIAKVDFARMRARSIKAGMEMKMNTALNWWTGSNGNLFADHGRCSILSTSVKPTVVSSPIARR